MTATLTTEITLGEDEYPATVEYSTSGRYVRATRTDPPEYPELQIVSVTIERDGKPVDVLGVVGAVSDEELERITELALEHADEAAADAREEYERDEAEDRRLDRERAEDMGDDLRDRRRDK